MNVCQSCTVCTSVYINVFVWVCVMHSYVCTCMCIRGMSVSEGTYAPQHSCEAMKTASDREFASSHLSACLSQGFFLPEYSSLAYFCKFFGFLSWFFHYFLHFAYTVPFPPQSPAPNPPSSFRSWKHISEFHFTGVLDMELSTLFFPLSVYPLTITPSIGNFLFGKNNLSAHDSLDISSWGESKRLLFTTGWKLPNNYFSVMSISVYSLPKDLWCKHIMILSQFSILIRCLQYGHFKVRFLVSNFLKNSYTLNIIRFCGKLKGKFYILDTFCYSRADWKMSL